MASPAAAMRGLGDGRLTGCDGCLPGGWAGVRWGVVEGGEEGLSLIHI